MKITKLGHCCLLVEIDGKVLMTDPGAWSGDLSDVAGVDAVLITHEHPDHFHAESLKAVLKNNPKAAVAGNSRMVELLAMEGIQAVLLGDHKEVTLAGVEVAGFGVEHAEIYRTIPDVMNTGFLIDKRFFYPGDAFTIPDVPVEVLAVPMIGPWMKMSEALDWAQAIKPRVCIPVHDGMLEPREWIYGNPQQVLGEAGIIFDALETGKQVEYL